MRFTPFRRDVVAVGLFALVACTDHSPTEADLAAKRNIEKSIHLLATQTVGSVSVAMTTPINVGDISIARADLFDPQGVGIITNLSAYTISWTTSNASVATVSSGADNDNEKVTAKAAGSANICATVNGKQGCKILQVLSIGALSAYITGTSTIPKAGQYTYTVVAQSGSVNFTFYWFKCPYALSSPGVPACQLLKTVKGSKKTDTETLYIHNSDGLFRLWVEVTDDVPYRATYPYVNIDARQAFEPTLTGPLSLYDVSGQNCTWTAHPVGGTAPYSYAWYLDGPNYYPVGSTTAITYTARLYGSSSHTMHLTVTDAAGVSSLLTLYSPNSGYGSPVYPCTDY